MSRSSDERTIMSMFQFMRPSGSTTEQIFIDTFLTPLGFVRDPSHNLSLTIGGNPHGVLFSSHMDTVHRKEGLQTLHYDGTTLSLSKAAIRNGSSCLGADDTAGVWLMTEMVKAGVPGLYMIHHAEEIGCIGSADLAETNPYFFADINMAVAFDRQGYSDVITHQMGRRTSSTAFGRSLAERLGGTFKASDHGVYTDTNEYADLVPECTNVSVGYFGQHTQRETQDVSFLIKLRDVLVDLKWQSLPIERDPSVQESDPWYDRRAFGYGGYSTTKYKSSTSLSNGGGLIELIKQYPEVAASVMEQQGMSRTAFMDEIAMAYGNVFLDDDNNWEDNAA